MTAGERRLLVVEDDQDLASLWTRCATGWGYVVRSAASLHEAVAQLAWQPRLILLDIHLPDGSGIELAARCLQVRPRPLIVATTGLASRHDVFALSKLGVPELLEKPFSLQDLKSALLRALKPPDPLLLVSPCVGHIPLPDLQRRIRREVLAEALAHAEGNVSQAARLLGMTRQAVQNLLRR